MPRIFISFRKADDRVTRERVYHRLSHQFGAEQVFKSGESIAPGTDYVQALLAQARQCHVMVVLIGAGWLAASDASGDRLLDRNEDWVRLEIRTALAAGNLVLPVLLGDGTRLPTATELPADIAALADRQAIRVPHSAVESGLNQLAEALSHALPGLMRPQSPESVGAPGQAGNSVNVGAPGQVGNSVNVGGNATGTVVGGDYTRTETHKSGGGLATSTAAALSAALTKAFSPVRTASAAAAHHRLVSGFIVLAVVSAGTGTAVALQSNAHHTNRPAAAGVSDPKLGLAGAQGASSAASPSVTVPAPGDLSQAQGLAITTEYVPGQTTAGYWSDGSVLVYTDGALTNNGGQQPTLDLDQIVTYSTATRAKVDSFTPGVLQKSGGCVVTLFRSASGKDVLLAEDTQPDSVDGNFATMNLVALNADSGAVLWTDPVPKVEQASSWCAQSPTNTTPESFMKQTPDGKYILNTQGGSASLINLDTGTQTAQPGDAALVGPWIALGSESGGALTGTVKLVNPDTGATVSTITNNVVEANNLLDPSTVIVDSPSAGGYVAISYPVGTGVSTPDEAFALPSGNQLWDSSVTGQIFFDPLTKSAVVAQPTGNDFNLAGLNSETGALTWTQDGIHTVCGITDGTIYAQNDSGTAKIMYASNGQTNYQSTTNQCPVVLDNVIVYVGPAPQEDGDETSTLFVVG